ncbi:MAG TPA: hypothetical protein VGD44_20705 [Phenylobacterium sp.]|jgi:hypothetical protein
MSLIDIRDPNTQVRRRKSAWIGGRLVRRAGAHEEFSLFIVSALLVVTAAAIPFAFALLGLRRYR